jgi:hypothetical protein
VRHAAAIASLAARLKEKGSGGRSRRKVAHLTNLNCHDKILELFKNELVRYPYGDIHHLSV